MMNKVFFALFFSLPLSLFAGGSDVGNGAEGVVCKDGVFLFDYLEIKDYEPQWKIDPYFLKQSEYKKSVDYFLNHLEKMDPERSKKYKSWWASFENEASWLDKSKKLHISPSNDSHSPLKVPSDCKKVNIVKQHLLLHGKRYIISKEIFDKLSAHEKTMTIIHELVYRDFLLLGEQGDSRRVRELTVFFVSKKFFSLEPQSQEYKKAIEASGLAFPSEKFIQLLYKYLLDREVESQKSLKYWSNECKIGNSSTITYRFLTSEEFRGKHLTLNLINQRLMKLYENFEKNVQFTLSEKDLSTLDLFNAFLEQNAPALILKCK